MSTASQPDPVPKRTLTVWRLVHERHVDRAFSGEGAEQYGGRFNSKGRKVVYTAGSLSLAMLELLVQANRRKRLSNHFCIPATIAHSHVEPRSLQEMPAGWDARPYKQVSQEFGDKWLSERESLVLAVPSVVVPQEYNYLINPEHEASDEIELGEPFPASFDRRLIE